MTGAHSDGRRHARPRVLALLVAVVLVAAASGVGVVLLRGSDDPKPTAIVTPTPTVTPPPVMVAPAIAAPPPTPTVPHDAVTAAAPTHFQIAGPGFTIDANTCKMANVRPLDPPGDQYHTVCWVYEGFGVAPGSSSGTSYILGHAWAAAPLVLNPLSEFAMDRIVDQPVTLLDGIRTQQTDAINGYTITLDVPGGVLTYAVTRTYAVAKTQAGNVASLMDEDAPNRIVIITCAVHNGADIEQNVIVEATLTSSRTA